jgi:hypothetical protein
MNHPIDGAIACRMRVVPEQFAKDDDHEPNVGDGAYFKEANLAGGHIHVGDAGAGGFAFWQVSVDQTERIMARRLAG